MTKSDVFELIVRAFGVYLLVLAILAIPSMLQGLVILVFYAGQEPHASGELGDVMRNLWTTSVFSSLGGFFRFVILILASINFLRSGSWVRKLTGCQLADEPNPSDA